jgi:cysteine sulfinate desulfinase/cysteine desulfurase-like protein
VLRALGLPDARVYTALRFGLGRYNEESEIETVVGLVAAAVRAARARSATPIS